MSTEDVKWTPEF